MDLKTKKKSKFVFHLIATILAVSIPLSSYFLYTKLLQIRFDQNVNSPSDHDITTFDPVVGMVLLPNIDQQVEKFKGEKRTLSYRVTTDSYGRRIAPLKEHHQKNEFALFFGGSFTMGVGVENNETIPFYFQDLSQHYQSYIYAYGGYGPQQMLAYTESRNLKNEIDQHEGVIIFI